MSNAIHATVEGRSELSQRSVLQGAQELVNPGSFEQLPHSLSPAALELLTQLREWVRSLPPDSVVVYEDENPNYGGFLFDVRPAGPDTVPVTVGLGAADDVDLFWGEGYRWEGWKATPVEVLEICQAIREGDVQEETWRLGKYVLEQRSYIRPHGERAGDGSFPAPRWLKRWAKLSLRTYSPW